MSNFPFEAHEDVSNNRSGIYAIVNIANGKLYIGSAVKLSKRKSGHVSKLTLGKHGNKYLQHSWNKYGKNYFIFKVVEYSEKESLLEREQFWIDSFDFKNELYNLTPTAGSPLGCKRSDEFKKKLSEANKGKIISEESRKRMSISAKSKVVSNKTRIKLSEIGKQRIHSIETRKKISNTNSGRKLSDETRKKISDKHKGKVLSDEHRKKISEGNQGAKRSDDFCKDVSERNRNRSLNDETRKKISIKNSKTVRQIDTTSDEHIIREFSSAKEAAEFLGMHPTSITSACTGKRKSAGGYKWRYVE